MNIQAKAKEIREAVSNMNSLVEGLKGLQDAIVPNERISAVMGQTIVPLIANLESQCARAIATCEQTTGEAIQRAETIAAHVNDTMASLDIRLTALETAFQENVDAVGEMFDAIASTRKRRVKS